MLALGVKLNDPARFSGRGRQLRQPGGQLASHRIALLVNLIEAAARLAQLYQRLDPVGGADLHVGAALEDEAVREKLRLIR